MKRSRAFHCKSFSSMLGVFKTTPKIGDLLEGLTYLSIYSYSWLRFITIKGYKAETAKEKRGVRGILSATVTTCAKCLLGRSLGSEAKAFVEPDHVGMLHLACTKIQTPRKKADTQHKPHCFYKWFRHSEPLLRI